MRNRGFEGWYFKHQKGDQTVAFIPGLAKSGSFIQVIDNNGSRQFDTPPIEVRDGVIHAGECMFSRQGIHICLPGIHGDIAYGALTPLKSDIMGPFRYFPMECRHGVISMGHDLSGGLNIDGEGVSFDGGRGYWEKDSGISFPDSYLWLQCNDFATPCSIMVSIANIPFAGLHFTGCICAIIFQGQEYRLATYKGVRILSAGPERICLQQGKLRLEIEVDRRHVGHPLSSPVRGQMSGLVRENNHAGVWCTLWEHDRPVFQLESHHAGFEYVAAQSR